MRSVLAPVAAALLLSGLLAGCSSPSSVGGPSASAAPQFQSSVLTLAQPTMPRDPPAPGERTLDKAPAWRLGEWWSYRLHDGFTGQDHEFKRIVAGEDNQAGNYLVGFPIDAFSDDIMLFHAPGYGDIRKADLAYETHDAYFQPLQFPLTDGATWQAEFEGRGKGPAIAHVEGGKATIDIAATGYNVHAVYDPEMGEITHMDLNNGTYATYDITGHGFGYTGVVRVPHAHDLIFANGRLGGVVDVNAKLVPPSPKGPTETVEVGPGYDRASFILAVGAGPFLGVDSRVPTGAMYRETATSPNGTQYQLTLLPSEGGFKMQAFHADNPDGAWTLEHIAGGAGIAFIEGIGYHSIDIDLPSGCALKSANAAHHGNLCKIDASQAGQVPAASSTTTG